MLWTHFKFVPAALLAVSAASAFVLPRWFAWEQSTQGVRGYATTAFAPVSRPARAVASVVSDSLRGRADSNGSTTGGADAKELADQLEFAKQEVASLQFQIAQYRELEHDQKSLGNLAQYCRPVGVMSSDPAGREVLQLLAGGKEGLTAQMPVLYRGGVVGRIERAGGGSAMVRLVTDRGFKLSAAFGRPVNGQFVVTASDVPLVEGAGNGTMRVRNLTKKHVDDARIKVDDWVVLNDTDWPTPMQGQRIGKITAITTRRDAPQFAEIEIRPTGELLRLAQVMVMVRDDGIARIAE